MFASFHKLLHLAVCLDNHRLNRGTRHNRTNTEGYLKLLEPHPALVDSLDDAL